MPTPKKTETKVIIPENTEADVVTTKNRLGESTTIKYKAEVKQDESTETDFENETQNPMDENQDDEDFSFNEIEEIPKDKLDKMFDEIEELYPNNSAFYAKVTRQPDSLSDNFNVRCNGEMPLGVFQFALRDRFNFIPQLQKLNSNSGGYFHILIFDGQQKALEVLVRYDYSLGRGKPQPITRQIGCYNLLVPNPIVIENTSDNQNNGNNFYWQKFEEMQRRSDEKFTQLLQLINKPREKSTLENAIEQKVLSDILNPKENTNGFEQTMMTIFAMPAMVEKMSDKIFPKVIQPIEPREPTTFDQITAFVQTPAAENLLIGAGNAIATMIEQASAAKFNANSQAQNNNNNQNQQPQENPTPKELENDMTENDLLSIVIKELQSDNVLDGNNEVIKELQSDYETEYKRLAITCQTLPFDAVFALLQNEAQTVNPNPLIPFVNVEETQKANKFVWNDTGEKLIVRLKELYKFLNPNWLQANPNL